MFQVKKVKKEAALLKLKSKPKSKEFKSWFGDSKVVDDQGNPMVMYHGNREPEGIDEFKKGKANVFWFAEDPEIATKFSGYDELAMVQNNPYNIIPAYLSVKNPIDLTKHRQSLHESQPDRFEKFYYGAFNDNFDPQAIIEMIEENNGVELLSETKKLLNEMENGEDLPLYEYFENSKDAPELIKLLQKQGFDGIKTGERFAGESESLGGEIVPTIGAFEPNQIKGRFNLKPTMSPKIMFQARKKSEAYKYPEGMKAEDMAKLPRGEQKRKLSVGESMEVQELAKEIFGTTNDIREAGYVLNDGTMLDFSGKNVGGSPGTRSFDHREINRVGDDSEGQGGDEKWDDVGMNEFMDGGAIRYMPESNAFNFMDIPENAQWEQIRKMVINDAGLVKLEYLQVEAEKMGGRFDDKFYVEYEKGTPYEKIKRDLLNYFRGGKKPSITQQFHFQARKKEDLELQNIPIENKRGLLSLAKHLTARAQEISDELGIDLTKNTDEAVAIVSDIIAAEIKAEVKNKKNAVGWYSSKMDKALDHLAKLYPEIKKDPIHNQVFKIGLAITSNGTAVQDNLKMALQVYEYWMENGQLPTKFEQGGKTAPAMVKGFNMYNRMVSEESVDFVHEFINTEFTFGELKRAGYSISGELVDTKIMGAIIFGPKVGGGFLSNLNGHYQYLTMDRWFMRTMGRIRGNLFPGIDYTDQLREFRSRLRASSSQMKAYGIEKADLKDDQKVISVAKKIFGKFTRDGFKKRTKLNNASRALTSRVEFIQDVPGNASNRKFFRRVMNLAVKKSGVKDLTMADAQAIIWFPEKRLFRKFGVGSQRGQKETNYEIESRNLVQRRSDDKRVIDTPRQKPTKQDDQGDEKADVKKKAEKPQKKIRFQVRHKRFLKEEKPPKEKSTPSQALELDPETFVQLWQRRIQDKMNRLGQVMKIVGEDRPVSDEEDAYRAAELFIGKAKERMEVFEEGMLGKGKFIDRLLDSDYTIDEFGDYLHARHAKERNKHVAKIRDDMPDGGSGMTNEAADKILDKHKGDKTIEMFAKEYYRKVTTRALRERLNAGLIDRKTYEHLTQYYKNYVPLFVIKDVENRTDTGGNEGKGFSVPQGSEIKRVKGSEEKRMNPIWSGMHEMMTVIKRSEKNQVGQKFLDIAEEFESDSWTVTKQRYRPIFNKHGEIEYMEPKFKLGDNIFAVRRDGSLYLIEIHDEALVTGLKNLGTERAPKYLVKINNFLRAIVTTYNPEFLITNFSRDIQTALIHVAGEHKGITLQVLKNTPKAIRGVWRNVRGKEEMYWSGMYAELKSAGGKVGWFEQDTLEEYADRVQRQMERIEAGGGSAHAAAKALSDLVNHANEAIESGVRLATYEALRSKGVSKELAAQTAKNITVNFNKKGEYGSLVNSLYLFFNATIQGSFRIGVSITKNKKTQAIVAGIVASSASLALVNYLIAPDEWEKIPKWQKDNYLIFMLPNGDDIRIRVPYGYNIFHALGQASADIIHVGQKDGFEYVDYGEAGMRMLLAASNAFNPFGDGSFFQMVAPTVLDPVVQIVENKKFHGGPLRPEQPPWSKDKPDYTQYWDVNPPSWMARSITEILSKWTGGNEFVGIVPDEPAVIKKGKKAKKKRIYPGVGVARPTAADVDRPDIVEKPATFKNHHTPGWIDVNPTTLDHLFEFVTGGMGKFIQRSIDLGIDIAAGEKTPAKDIPIVRQFYGQPDKRGITETVLIRKMLKQSEIRVYNHVEVARFKRYVFDAIKLGRLTERQAELVTDEKGKEIPRVIRDFLNAQRLARGIPKIDYRKASRKKTVTKKKKKRIFP